MQKLKSRIERMEKQLIPPSYPGTIIVLPNEDQELKIREYQGQYPGQPLPTIIRINFIEAPHHGELDAERSRGYV